MNYIVNEEMRVKLESINSLTVDLANLVSEVTLELDKQEEAEENQNELTTNGD